MKLKLKKPITVDGQEYQELDFDFDGLTGADLLKARAGLSDNAAYMDNLLPALSMDFQANVSAEAAKVSINVIKALPAKDFMKITKAEQDFLSDKG